MTKGVSRLGQRPGSLATGLAKEVDDSPDAEAEAEAEAEAAKASPGTVIERKLDVKLPAGAPKKCAAKKTKQPSAADRKRVEEGQLALDDLDAMHGQAARRLDEELQALRARGEEERTAYEAQREKLQARLEKALAKL